MAALHIRPEHPDDADAIRDLLTAAFGQPDEAYIVDRLRAETPGYRAWTALREDVVVGHIAYSPVAPDPPRPGLSLLGLAPMAVAPEHQRAGIGSALVETSLEALREAEVAAVVVLGHPAYYPRFGFRPASRMGLRSLYDVPDEVFMALAMQPDALDGVDALVRYAPAFDG